MCLCHARCDVPHEIDVHAKSIEKCSSALLMAVVARTVRQTSEESSIFCHFDEALEQGSEN